MKSLEAIVHENNRPLNERLRHASTRNDACVLREDDVHALVELLDAVEDMSTSSWANAAHAMRRIRGR